MDDEKKKRLEDAGWQVGDADEFLDAKPKRPQKIEASYADSNMQVEFDNDFGGEWMVYIKGHFADFEIKEISNALKAVNKSGKL